MRGDVGPPEAISALCPTPLLPPQRASGLAPTTSTELPPIYWCIFYIEDSKLDRVSSWDSLTHALIRVGQSPQYTSYVNGALTIVSLFLLMDLVQLEVLTPPTPFLHCSQAVGPQCMSLHGLLPSQVQDVAFFLFWISLGSCQLVLPACPPTWSWSLWIAVLPSAYQLFTATWWHLQAFKEWIFSWPLINLDQFRSLQHYRVSTCLQVEYDPLTTTLWAWPPKEFFTYLVLPPRL